METKELIGFNTWISIAANPILILDFCKNVSCGRDLEICCDIQKAINNNEKLYIYQNVRCIEIFDQEGFENVCTEDDEIIKCPCCNKIICVESVCCN